MAEQKERARIILKNIFSEIERIAAAISAFGQKNDLSDEVIYDLRLVLEEIVSNIIKYGYKDNEEHQIDIQINLERNILTLEVKDDGNPFNPLEVGNTAVERPLDERGAGGMGIYIVKNLMNKSEYHRVENSNILLLKKYITK
jgi:anti-sigma regulatory factor (Ser/Thr protein kinase)